MGFCEVLTLILITLKLTGVIAWSWSWVLLPMIPAILFLIVSSLYLFLLCLDGLREIIFSSYKARIIKRKK